MLSRLVLALAVTTMLSSAAFAQMSEEERNRIWDSAISAALKGPADVPIKDQAVLHVPPGMVYIPPAPAGEVMHMWGNSVGPTFQGLVFSTDEKAQWTIVLDHVAEGYVKDDDAKTWNADDLLQSLKDGTEQQNGERTAMGLPAMDVVGWVQSPQYDSSQHRLVWSLKAVDRGAAAGAPATINYNTYKLGRDGYFEVNLLTSDTTVEADKAAAFTTLEALEYNSGKRYQDFDPSTDHVAEYGLAALVAGIAAKKLGFLAAIGVFAAKFAKLIIAGVAVAGGALMKILRRNASA